MPAHLRSMRGYDTQSTRAVHLVLVTAPAAIVRESGHLLTDATRSGRHTTYGRHPMVRDYSRPNAPKRRGAAAGGEHGS